MNRFLRRNALKLRRHRHRAGPLIVKRYVDLMGGFIDVKSVLHKGTRWIVSLPIAKRRTERRKVDASKWRRLRRKTCVLLCGIII